MPLFCYKWKNCSIPWNMTDWKWSECRLVEEILGNIYAGGPGELALPPWLREEHPHDPYQREKRDRFIQLLCKVKEYPEYEEKKKVRTDIKITIEDVALVVKKVSGIDITTK